MSQTANRIVKNTVFLYARMGITMFISLWTTRIVLNALGVSDFGIYSIIGGAIGMLGFLNSSLANSTLRFMSYAEGSGCMDRKLRTFNMSVLLHFFIGTISVLLLSAAGFLFFNGLLNIPNGRESAAVFVYGGLVLSTFLQMQNVPYEAVLNAHENMRFYAITGFIESVLKLSIAFCCVYTLYDKLIVYGLLMALLPALMFLVLASYCRKRYKECKLHPFRYYEKSLLKELTSFASWRMLESTASLITMQGVSVLLNAFGGVIVNTAHGIANQLSGQLLAFSNGMLKALNPVIVKRQGAGEMNNMMQAAITGCKLSFFLYAIVAIPFIVETPYLLGLWLNQVPEWAVMFVRLVLIRQLFSQITITLDTCVLATGHIKNFSIAGTIIWALPMGVGIIMYNMGAPIYTIYILLIIMVLIRCLKNFYFCNKLCSLHVKSFFNDVYSPCCVSLIIMFALIGSFSSCQPMSLCRALVVLFMSPILFLFASYYILFNQTERMIILDMLNHLKKRLNHL